MFTSSRGHRTPSDPPAPVPSVLKKRTIILWIVAALCILVLLINLAAVPGLMREIASTFQDINHAIRMNPRVDVAPVEARSQKPSAHERAPGKTSSSSSLEQATYDAVTRLEESQPAVAISSPVPRGNAGIEIKSAGGAFKIGAAGAGNAPAWIRDYPGAEPKGSFSAQTSEGSSISFAFKTQDSVDKVAGYYEGGFKSSGWRVLRSPKTASGSAQSAFLSAEDETGKHSTAVRIGSEGGATAITVTYQVKK